ncbi:MAG: hypothetical protein ACREL6_00235 [Gemmatimonadales bacterium]
MNGALPVRVTIHDTWEEIPLAMPGSTPVGEVKRRALSEAGVIRDPGEYVVKFRGAHLSDETRSLAEHNVLPNAALIVLARRRRPLR